MNLSLQQKDAAAKGKLEPSSLLTFWKHTVTLVTSPPGNGNSLLFSLLHAIVYSINTTLHTMCCTWKGPLYLYKQINTHF